LPVHEGAEGEAVRRAEVGEEVVITRGEPAAADDRVRRDEAIERIARPGLLGGGEPLGGRRRVDPPPRIVDQATGLETIRPSNR
jgi:hypothetical protein